MKLDALEDLLKARKPKGLDNWKKLESLAEALKGKQASDISFTTSYPGQEGSKKYLGSSAGNLHFLLGYVNPAFHVAPYHWKIVDPNLTDQEIAKKEHPANPRYWKTSGLVMEDEGDLDNGVPHPSSKASTNVASRASKKEGAIQVMSGYGEYAALPDTGKVYSLTNGHVYDWRIVRESFFASTNPDLAHKMDLPYEEDVQEVEKSLVQSLSFGVVPFDKEVYPLFKSVLPKPGSVVKCDSLYFLVKSDRIEVYDKNGVKQDFVVFDRTYDCFDLKKGGDVHPSILLNLIDKYFKVSLDSFSEFVHKSDYLPQFSKGLPSPGFEALPYDTLFDREVIEDNGVFRVQPLIGSDS